MPQRLQTPTIVVQGDVDDRTLEYAREKLVAVAQHAPRPVRRTELRLIQHTDPARERPCHVEMTVDLDGTVVRAHRRAPTMFEAVDRSEARLRRRIDAIADRPKSAQRRHRDEASWHHDDAPTTRADFFPRPAEERELVRRKSFARRPESIEDALFDIETLDHDFYLFVHDESGTEAVAFRTEDGYGVAQRVPTPAAIARVGTAIAIGSQPPTTTVDDARALLDATGAPFVFFVDGDTDHAMVVYRRYDGHDGLIACE
jgi:ribosome-associated translation inhibitor RaiA